MKPKFEPDIEREIAPAEDLVELEGLDASEQMFATSLDRERVHPVFTVNPDNESDQSGDTGSKIDGDYGRSLSEPGGQEQNTDAQEFPPADLNVWKKEVTARVSRYRSRRPREPRYPSLLLKFEKAAPETTPDEQQPIPVSLNATAAEIASHPSAAEIHVELAGKLLEFPRSMISAPLPLDELAGPVPSLPRILEVPDAPPLRPALGGILIEREAGDEANRRPGFEIPLHSASMTNRILASAIDFALVLGALAGFGYIFWRITHQIPAILQAVGMLGMVGGLFWAAYQYAFLVYTGSTPGLIVTRLELSCFGGDCVSRKSRRWRVLASYLSAASLGLGYFWCFLDEDQLCWHDRITTTYMAPRPAKTQTSK